MDSSDLWYKNAIIYALDVETFADSDGDGVGDFPGLIERLDYLSELGVTCLWLQPFYPTPNKDDGYDVQDHCAVDSRLGTPDDFSRFLDEAHERGIRVLIDLVVNHTSDQHPWFQSARENPDSPYREYYIWRDHPVETSVEPIVFEDGEKPTPWSYDEQAGAYYFHLFYDFEPELNTSNPAVREEIRNIVGFWLDRGVDGFRVDAAPYFGENPATVETGDTDPHPILRDIRQLINAHGTGAVMIAEADVEADALADFFDDGRESHLLFNFYLNNYLFLSLARQEAEPMVHGLRALPSIPSTGQWANFIRNHDELDLEHLSDAEREEVYRAFAPDEDMRIYGRGIRRRLPPMLNGDRGCIELVQSLLFSLPGIPIVRYGDEIGMGDDLSLPDRESVRTPMQWSDKPNGGFSTAEPEALVRPIIEMGDYSYQRINVAAQWNDSDSLLNWTKRAIACRKETPELGWSDWRIIDTGQPHIFGIHAEWQGNVIITLHNLSSRSCLVSLDPDDLPSDRLEDVFSNRGYDTPVSPHGIDMDGYGYRWLRCQTHS